VKRISLFQFSSENEQTNSEADYQAYHFLQIALDEINHYLNAELTTFTVQLDFSRLTPFQTKVYQQVLIVPYGEVVSYQQIALAINQPGAARAVGAALAKNPLLFLVPCHRIISTGGDLTGFAAPEGIKTKAWLLKMEKATILKNQKS
jgi:methylated-DNA-[protein]-cysteine S-methyltransferase